IRHMGPMAQDFRAAFGLGEDDTTISVVDEQGVALAAIQGLYAQNMALATRVATQDARIAALEQDRVQSPAPTLPELPLSWALLGGLAWGGAGIGYGLRARR